MIGCLLGSVFTLTRVPIWSEILNLLVPRVNLTVNPLDNPILGSSLAAVIVKSSCNLGERVFSSQNVSAFIKNYL